MEKATEGIYPYPIPGVLVHRTVDAIHRAINEPLNEFSWLVL